MTVGPANLAGLHQMLDAYVPLFRPVTGNEGDRMSSSSQSTVRVSTWPLVLTAAAILTITMGARQSLGCSCRR